jgi:excisionase family DNA binding protein
MTTSAGMCREAELIKSLIRLSEAASLADVHPATLRRWIAQGRLREWRTAGNQIRVHRDEVLTLATPVLVGTETAADCEGAA